MVQGFHLLPLLFSVCESKTISSPPKVNGADWYGYVGMMKNPVCYYSYLTSQTS
jgi:hypothetical protein